MFCTCYGVQDANGQVQSFLEVLQMYDSHLPTFFDSEFQSNYEHKYEGF